MTFQTLDTFAPTSAPTAAPTAAYVPIGVGSRCMEGGFIPLTQRKLLGLEQEAVKRDLQQYTAADCYVRCFDAGYTMPYHFSYSAALQACWCCGAVCTLEPDPTFVSYVVNSDPVSMVSSGSEV